MNITLKYASLGLIAASVAVLIKRGYTFWALAFLFVTFIILLMFKPELFRK